ncbi:hypothetical protein ACJJIL_05850 [Microbulbifer sp. EKSA005]|uniref:hypothetical protein n=1 Tax=Microbulbifer sp. EKSA005 TaxID=3243364 RepID=UPI004042671D
MIKLFFIVIILALLPTKGIAADIFPAKSIASYWIDNSSGVGLSGLTFCDQLITISPKESEKIYRINLYDQGATLESHLNFSSLPPPRRGETNNVSHFVMDLLRPKSAMRFGGVCCRDNGTFVLSERYHRVAHVEEGGRSTWLHDKWSAVLRHMGYHLKYNNGGEGIVEVGNSLWIAMEREPRGLLKIGTNGEFQVFSLPSVAELDFRGHPENLRGLDYHDGALFTLESNAHAVCRRALPSLQAEWCLVYREVEESPEHAYEVSRLGGMGSGVAVNNQGVFVVFNNNNISRARDPLDRRARLLHLAFPDGKQ